MWNNVTINSSESNNPVKGDSYYDNESINIFNGSDWNKMYYDTDIRRSIRELEIIDRKNRRIDKIKRLFD